MNAPLPKTIGIAVHSGKPMSRDRLGELLRLLASRGVTVMLEPEAAGIAGLANEARKLPEIGRKADLVIVLGGDGTILRVARELEDAQVPILGVNLGSLGFLTSVRGEDISAAVAATLQGRYEVSERQTVQASLFRGGRQIETHWALNDVVLSRSAFSRIVRLRIAVDDELLTEYMCDGMIFATATGSTAYSLSAGGPILLPTAGGFVITPICPHALSNRPVVVGEQSVVRSRVVSAAGELLLTVDGQVQVRMEVADEVEVRRGARPVKLATPPGHSYFDVLRQKLKWSGVNV